MHIGFLDCKTNSKDAWTVFSQLADHQANVQAVRLTAPNPFKVPAACKKLFAQGVDAIVAAVTTEADNEHEIGFLRDKVADVEIAEAKYVFLVIEDVHVRDEQLSESLQRALVQALEYLPAPTEASLHSSEPHSGMDLFSQSSAGALGPVPGQAPTKGVDDDAADFLEEHGSRKLF